MHDRGRFAAALLATALGGLQHAVVGTLSPQLIADLGDPDLYALVAGGYLIAAVGGASGVFLFGRRFTAAALLRLGLLALVGGLVLGLAGTAMWQLVLGRTLAGAGAGVAFVATFALAGPRASRVAAAVAMFGAAVAVGSAAGSWLTEVAGWRWVFAANLVIALVAVVLERRADPAAADAREGLPGDPAAQHDWGSLVALGPASGAAFVALLFLPVAAGSGPGGGWAGGAVVAVPLALAALAGGMAAARVASIRAAGFGLSFLAVGLVARAVVGSDRGAGAGVAVVVGLGAGLALSGLARSEHGWGRRPAAAHVAVRQGAGVVGLALAGLAMLTVMREQLLVNLRPIVDAVLDDVPDELRDLGRIVAEGALRTLGDNLSPANLADSQRGFASIVLEQIPAEFQAAAEPYRDALNLAFSDALTAGLGASFLVGAGLAVVALGVLLAGHLAGGGRRVTRDVRQSG